MRQVYKFQESKLDELHEQVVYFFEVIYFQSLQGEIPWNDSFIHPRLKPIYDNCPKLRTTLKQVHSNYISVSNKEKYLIFESAINSSDIGGICNATILIGHIDDFTAPLGNAIHNLFRYLYYQLPDTKIFKNLYGDLITHYNNLKRLNRKIKMCPFCGMLPVKPLNSSTRQTYDHYLPLSKYPFLALNTKNLVPTCKDCNEDHKKDKDVLYRNKARTLRRKLIYPFGHYNYTPIIIFKGYNFNPTTLEITNCSVQVSNTEGVFRREFQSWDEIYELNYRYKITVIDDSKEWYEEYLDFVSQKQIDETYVSEDLSYKDYLNALKTIESTSNSFLKRPFFIEMERLTNVFS